MLHCVISPFLNNGITFSCFQAPGKVPFAIHLLNKMDRGSAKADDVSLSIQLLILSGSVALPGFSLFNVLYTSSGFVEYYIFRRYSEAVSEEVLQQIHQEWTV